MPPSFPAPTFTTSPSPSVLYSNLLHPKKSKPSSFTTESLESAVYSCLMPVPCLSFVIQSTAVTPFTLNRSTETGLRAAGIFSAVISCQVPTPAERQGFPAPSPLWHSPRMCSPSLTPHLSSRQFHAYIPTWETQLFLRPPSSSTPTSRLPGFSAASPHHMPHHSPDTVGLKPLWAFPLGFLHRVIPSAWNIYLTESVGVTSTTSGETTPSSILWGLYPPPCPISPQHPAHRHPIP